MSFDVGLKIPVVTHVVGGQLEMPAILEVGASWTFGGGGAVVEEHDHDHHDHDHDHDHDHHDDGPVELVPVPGKITIVDFYASWCEPCKTLEPALQALARAHSDRVALQKIDASDWESYPFEMPHVVVFDAAGVRIFDESSDGDLAKLIAAITAIVEPAPGEIRIQVTEDGFVPATVTVPAATPVVLIFERKTDNTCATEVIMVVDGVRIERALPLDQPVTLSLTFPSPGTITYACGMDMIRGTIEVQ